MVDLFKGLFQKKMWGGVIGWKPIKIWGEGVVMCFDLGRGGSKEFQFGG